MKTKYTEKELKNIYDYCLLCMNINCDACDKQGLWKEYLNTKSKK